MRLFFAAVIPGLFVFMSCAGSEGGPKCISGESRACACTNGRSGAQLCGPSGTFGTCQCDPGSGGGGGTAGSGGGGGTAGPGGGGGSPLCPSCRPLEECHEGRCVAKLVAVTGGFSIDATEVTRSQYEEWLATSPSTGSQDPWCSWDTDYAPTCQWPPGSTGNHPVVCVDWCDAYAYCKAVGKRLCGKMGGGANHFGDYANASLSQWHNACTSNGVNDYPYGSTFDGQACNGEEYGAGTTVEVGSLSGCQSSETGYGEAYDLSGNVWEWDDSCNATTGPKDGCRLRGGSFDCSLVVNLQCGFDLADTRDDKLASLGFRCCAP